MTPLEIILLILLWIILGVFICHKAKWYRHIYDEPHTSDEKFEMSGCCVVTIAAAPIVFTWDVLNRMFIKKWH